MREIKFRAWIPGSKRMIYPPFELDFIEDGHIEVKKYDGAKVGDFEVRTNFGCTGSNCFLENGVKLNQFTGLHDKNGTEVYEFDRLARALDIGEVRWDELEARFRVFVDDNKPTPRNYPITSDCEVVGNKYEQHSKV